MEDSWEWRIKDQMQGKQVEKWSSKWLVGFGSILWKIVQLLSPAQREEIWTRRKLSCQLSHKSREALIHSTVHTCYFFPTWGKVMHKQHRTVSSWRMHLWSAHFQNCLWHQCSWKAFNSVASILKFRAVISKRSLLHNIWSCGIQCIAVHCICAFKTLRNQQLWPERD